MTGTFYVGLTMAGAVSAGAYNAGVFDFLMEALETWESKRGEGRETIPQHRVVIGAVSGASAGGITGALALATMIQGFKKTPYPVDGLGKDGGTGGVQCFMPQLYQTWVVRPRFVSLQNGCRSLLDVYDLEQDCGRGSADHAGTLPLKKGVRSLLDATALDWIAASALKLQPDPTFQPRPYIAKDIDLFLTVTNLRGIPYNVEFSGPAAPDQTKALHGMRLHGDRVHFRIAQIGSASLDSSWAGRDQPGPPLEPRTLNSKSIPADWLAFAEAAKASGAFPVGLRSRYFATATTADWQQRQWTLPLPDGLQIKPNFPANSQGLPDYAVPFTSVDGGAIDNEPFQLARWSIMKDGRQTNERAPDRADRAVIMVDPFPELPAFDPADMPDNLLTSVIGALPGALINQARFKLNDLIDALQEDVLSRFLILPRRNKNNVLQQYGIACGLLGGFGGFLYEAFRAHDYQLGRRNCQAFLREAFALPRENPLFDNAATPKPEFTASNPDPAKTGETDRWHQIIPLMPELQAEIQLPEWPRMPMADFETFLERAMLRADKVVEAILRDQVGSWLFRKLLGLAWSVGLDGKVKRIIRDSFLKDLILRDQIAMPDWIAAIERSTPNDATRQLRRKVMAALADGKYDLRTAPGIAVQLKLKPDQIGEIEAFLQNLDDLAWRGSKAVNPQDGRKYQTYTLALRKPDWIRRTLVVRWIAAPVLGDLSIDVEDIPVEAAP